MIGLPIVLSFIAAASQVVLANPLAAPDPLPNPEPNPEPKLVTISTSRRTIMEQLTIPVPTRIPDFTTKSYLWERRPTTEGHVPDDHYYWGSGDYDDIQLGNLRENFEGYGGQYKPPKMSYQLDHMMGLGVPLCLQWCIVDGINRGYTDCHSGDVGCQCKDWYNIDPGMVCTYTLCPGNTAKRAVEIFNNMCATFDYHMRNQIDEEYIPYFTRANKKKRDIDVPYHPRTLLPHGAVELVEGKAVLAKTAKPALPPAVAVAEPTPAASAD